MIGAYQRVLISAKNKRKFLSICCDNDSIVPLMLRYLHIRCFEAISRCTVIRAVFQTKHFILKIVIYLRTNDRTMRFILRLTSVVFKLCIELFIYYTYIYINPMRATTIGISGQNPSFAVIVPFLVQHQYCEYFTVLR